MAVEVGTFRFPDGYLCTLVHFGETSVGVFCGLAVFILGKMLDKNAPLNISIKLHCEQMLAANIVKSMKQTLPLDTHERQ